MKENWYALLLCTMKDISIDEALKVMRRGEPKKHNARSSKTKYGKRTYVYNGFKYVDDPLKLIELKKNHSYKQIAKIYGTCVDTIVRDITHFKQRQVS